MRFEANFKLLPYLADFRIKIDYVDITEDEFQQRMEDYKSELARQFEESHELEGEIMKQLESLELN